MNPTRTFVPVAPELFDCFVPYRTRRQRLVRLLGPLAPLIGHARRLLRRGGA